MILRLEIEPGGKAEILVGRPGIAIDAAVLAAAIRIEARLESDIGTIVASDDRFRDVAKILRLPARPFFALGIDIDNIRIVKIEMEFFEPISRAPRCATPVDGRTALRRLIDNRDQLPICHETSSHEHIRLSSKTALSQEPRDQSFHFFGSFCFSFSTGANRSPDFLTRART